jgi:hypothetical protein
MENNHRLRCVCCVAPLERGTVAVGLICQVFGCLGEITVAVGIVFILLRLA